MKGQAGRKCGDNITQLTKAEKGTSKAYTLTRLQKDNPEVLPMFREAMKGQAGRPKTGSNPTLLEKDRGKAYTLTRLQKDNPEEEAKKASRSARAAEMVKAGTHGVREAAREVGISHPAVIKAVTRNKVTSKKVTKAKPPQPTIKLADPHRTAANILGMLYLSRKRSVGEHTGNQHTDSELYQNDTIPNNQSTREIVARETGVSPATIMRDAEYAEARRGRSPIQREPTSTRKRLRAIVAHNLKKPLPRS
jgi:hypothetical protein